MLGPVLTGDTALAKRLSRPHSCSSGHPHLQTLKSLNLGFPLGPVCRAGRKYQGASPSIPQPHLQPQELLKRWLDLVRPYHHSYSLGEASVSGDSHHLRLPNQVILPTPVTANTGPPIPLWPRPSFPCVSSPFSLPYLPLALGSDSIHGKTKWQWSGWSVFTLKKKPGLPSPASPHPIPVCFSLARITPPTLASRRISTPSILAHPTTLPTSPPAASVPLPSPRPPTSSRRLLTVSPTRLLSHWPVSPLTFALICACGLSSRVKEIYELWSKRSTRLDGFLSSPPLVTCIY